MAAPAGEPTGPEPGEGLHRTLLRQLRRLQLSTAAAPSLEAWREFVERVSATYAQSDDDRYTLERAIDISSEEMQQLHAMLARRARTDELTGLANRAALVDDLSAALAYAPGAPEVVVLFIDLDHFKPVNDHYGHSVGDELLVQVASRLRSSVRHGDVVARYGGDEFVAVLGGQTSQGTAVAIGQRIVGLIGEPFHLGVDRPVRIGASVGLARARPGVDVAHLLHEADSAMYDAKLQGRGRLVAFPERRTTGRTDLRSIG
jgi:diguanylate cyclase (GGDEF)-like protein